jgi:hypothetical protein
MSAITATAIRDAIQSAFRGKPVKRVELFGSAARGEMSPDSDVDILVTPTPEATRQDLFIMAAEVEDALGRPVDFLIRSQVNDLLLRLHQAMALVPTSGAMTLQLLGLNRVSGSRPYRLNPRSKVTNDTWAAIAKPAR